MEQDNIKEPCVRIQLSTVHAAILDQVIYSYRRGAYEIDHVNGATLDLLSVQSTIIHKDDLKKMQKEEGWLYSDTFVSGCLFLKEKLINNFISKRNPT